MLQRRAKRLECLRRTSRRLSLIQHLFTVTV
jgi:hypothetical protein